MIFYEDAIFIDATYRDNGVIRIDYYVNDRILHLVIERYEDDSGRVFYFYDSPPAENIYPVSKKVLLALVDKVPEKYRAPILKEYTEEVE